MGANPLRSQGKKGQDIADEWQREIEKAVSIIKLPERLKIKFGIYMLVDDGVLVEYLTRDQVEGEEPNWDEFETQLKQAYIGPISRESQRVLGFDIEKQDIGKIYGTILSPRIFLSTSIQF